MDELERRLRELDPPLPSPRPVTQLRERARGRRVRRRAASASAAMVAAAAVVVAASAVWPGGGPAVVLDGGGDEGPDEPAVGPSGEPPSSPSAASGDAGGAFVPDTRTEDGSTVVPVTFPDGTTGELVYPADLALVDEGVTPHVRAGIAPDEAGEPPLRRSLELHRGRVTDVLTQVNDGRSPRQVASHPNDVALWAMADDVLDHDYLCAAGGRLDGADGRPRPRWRRGARDEPRPARGLRHPHRGS